MYMEKARLKMGKLIGKRIFVFILAFLMLFATACSNNENASATQVGPNTNDQSLETSSETESWPNQPINIMVPASAGGATDIFSRTLGQFITEKTGAPVVITNMSGLSGYEMVRNQEPNGYNYAMAITGLLISKAQGDLDYGHEVFDPVAAITGDTTTGLIVRGDSPYATLEDLFNAIKADSEAVTGGISMTGYPYLYILAIEESLDLDLYCVDAGNSAERNTALLGGQVDFIISNAAVTKLYLESGDFRYLGIVAADRNDFIPEVPTFEEQGFDLVFPGQGAYVVAPQGTDKETVDAFNALLSEIFEMDAYKEKMLQMNFAVGAGLTVSETQDELDSSAESFAKYIENYLKISAQSITALDSAQFIPKLTFGGLIFLGLIVSIQGVGKISQNKMSCPEGDVLEASVVGFKRALVAVVSIGMFIFLMTRMGFIFAAIIYLVFNMYFMVERRGWKHKTYFMVAVIISVSCFYLFDKFIFVRLPLGFLKGVMG